MPTVWKKPSTKGDYFIGVAHLSPSGTRNNSWYNNEEIVDYKRQHISTTQIPEDQSEAEHLENSVVSSMCTHYGFERVQDGCEWITSRGVDEKVVAETRHGAELRIKYHPDGAVYFFIVVVTGEFSQENLAIQHLENYNKTLREVLDRTYGEVRRKTGRWTSEPIEI